MTISLYVQLVFRNGKQFISLWILVIHHRLPVWCPAKMAHKLTLVHTCGHTSPLFYDHNQITINKLTSHVSLWLLWKSKCYPFPFMCMKSEILITAKIKPVSQGDRMPGAACVLTVPTLPLHCPDVKHQCLPSPPCMLYMEFLWKCPPDYFSTFLLLFNKRCC